MECGEIIEFESLIVDCDGCPSLSTEPTTTVTSSTPLDCDQQDLSLESLFYLLLNSAGTAIKTITI